VLRLRNLEEIEALLLRVPGIVQQFEVRDPEFILSLKTWLSEAATTLADNRMPISAEVAGYRGALISAERGFWDGAEPRGRSNARKLREARAAGLLKQASGAVQSAIAARRGQVDEAERIMRQIVAVSYHIGLLQPDPGGNRSTYLRSTWQAISKQAEIASLVVHVVALIGNTDVLIELDRAIAQIGTL